MVYRILKVKFVVIFKAQNKFLFIFNFFNRIHKNRNLQKCSVRDDYIGLVDFDDTSKMMVSGYIIFMKWHT